MKLHQIYSGTVKFESGSSKTLDLSKAKYINDTFAGKKIGIFYKFKEELKALQKVFGDTLTTELGEFVNTNKNIKFNYPIEMSSFGFRTIILNN